MPEPELTTLQARPVVAIRRVTTPEKIGDTCREIFGILGPKFAAGEFPMAGPPYARYFSFSPERVELEVGAPVAKPMPSQGEIAAGELPGGRAATLLHVGPYEGLKDAYPRLERWMKEQGHACAGAPFEVYETDPSREPDASKWRTRIYWPVG
ncbi:MAG: GyrI-like domain-containing protein [Planctomycetota bacterium]|nr:GyrI-like domain-containing protein [Planctomycetota bacterium]